MSVVNHLISRYEGIADAAAAADATDFDALHYHLFGFVVQYVIVYFLQRRDDIEPQHIVHSYYLSLLIIRLFFL